MASAKQTALVVGASRGIGRQIAIDLATNGYKGKVGSAMVTKLASANVIYSHCRSEDSLECLQPRNIPSGP